MRKRARDRRSQQAMRDRNKYALQSLEHQVVVLTRALEHGDLERQRLTTRLQALETQNEFLVTQNAALGLRLLGAPPPADESVMAWSPLSLPCAEAPRPWQQLPCNSASTCLSDQILQDFVSSQRRLSVSSTMGNGGRLTTDLQKPNLCSMLKKGRSSDETSNVVGDIVRSYSEIEALPKQVAVHYIMSVLFTVGLIR
jgi:hypothetical protein